MGSHVERNPPAATEPDWTEPNSWDALRATFDHAAVGLVHVAPDGQWLRFNQTFADITGYPPEELLLLRFDDITHPDDIEPGWALTRKLLAGEMDHFSLEKRYIRKDGSVQWVSVTVSLVRDAEGRPKNFISIVQDIQKRKVAEFALAGTERRQRLLLQISDAARRLSTPQEIAEEACRLTAEALDCAHCGYLLVFPDENRLSIECDCARGVPSFSGWYPLDFIPEVLQEDYRRGETVVFSDSETDPRTAAYYLSLYEPGYLRSGIAVPINRAGRWVGNFCVYDRRIREWTAEEIEQVKNVAFRLFETIERASAELEVQRANQELERRVEERTAALQVAHKRMETFTYHVSHDLRAPLRTIISTSRILEEDFGGQLNEEARVLLGRQSRAAASLAHLIDDLLKLSRLGRAQLEPETVDLSEMATAVLQEALANYPVHHDTEIEPGLSAFVDPRLIRLALENLFDNAAKYSPGGGAIRFGRRPDGVYVASDEGIGIEGAYLDKIFEPFQRLHREEEFAGTGIGLANVRQVVERHGGTIWAESEPGAGTSFCFTLPGA